MEKSDDGGGKETTTFAMSNKNRNNMEENKEEQSSAAAVPPPVNDSTDGSADAALLRAISARPDLARALADIAAGKPARDVLAPLLGEADTAEAAAATPEAAEPEPEVAMYQSPALAGRKPENEADSFPSFLSNTQPDFWDGF